MRLSQLGRQENVDRPFLGCIKEGFEFVTTVGSFFSMASGVRSLRLPMCLLHMPVKFTMGFEGFPTYFTNKAAAGHVFKRFFRNRRRPWNLGESRADFRLDTKRDISNHKLHKEKRVS